jgi:hypothetical protein
MEKPIYRHIVGTPEPGTAPPLPPRVAWENPEWRELVVAELSRSVSKYGSFGLAGGLGWLAGPDGLTADQAAALFHSVRERSRRLEVEWQPEFEAAFPESRGRIPPLDPRLVAWAWHMSLAQAILWHPRVECAREAVEELRRAGVPFDQLGKWASESIERRYPMPAACDPGAGVESDGLTIRELAERVGATEIAEYLRSVGVP